MAEDFEQDPNMIRRLPFEIMDPVPDEIWRDAIKDEPIDPYYGTQLRWPCFKAYWLDPEQNTLVAVYEPALKLAVLPCVFFRKAGIRYYPIQRTKDIEEKCLQWRILEVMGHGAK